MMPILNVYFGGTLFEAFAIRDQFEDYIDILKNYDLKYAEVSMDLFLFHIKKNVNILKS